MIKNSSHDRPPEAVLYYVRLRTHCDTSLFDASDHTQMDSHGLLAQIAADELLIAANHQGISLNQWVIVPDALHALVSIRENRPDYASTARKPRLLTSFVASFKAATAKRINLMRNQLGSPVWQRSYEAQRIEDEFMLNRLSAKITEADNVVASSRLMPH
ncbi:MAG: hypothetical protein WA885_23695 [Phormidesmis sp.]